MSLTSLSSAVIDTAAGSVCSLEAVSEEFLGVFADPEAKLGRVAAPGGGHNSQRFQDEGGLVPFAAAPLRRQIWRIGLDQDAVRGRARGMVHCFSEGPEEVDEWMRRGFFVSFAGTVTYPKNDALRRAAARAPADRVLVETDAPYLTPQARRGERNEPAFVLETLAAVASARGRDPAELGRRIAENAQKLFGDRF